MTELFGSSDALSPRLLVSVRPRHTTPLGASISRVHDPKKCWRPASCDPPPTPVWRHAPASDRPLGVAGAGPPRRVQRHRPADDASRDLHHDLGLSEGGFRSGRCACRAQWPGHAPHASAATGRAGEVSQPLAALADLVAMRQMIGPRLITHQLRAPLVTKHSLPSGASPAARRAWMPRRGFAAPRPSPGCSPSPTAARPCPVSLG